MIITISGLPGSGKSTIGKIVAEKLGYKFYSVGDLRGRMAMDRGMTIDELNELGKREDWTDKQADEYQIELAKKENDFVIDGRLSFYFISDSFKVFLRVDLREAAKRVFKNQRADEKKVGSAAEMEELMRKRIKDDEIRYQKYYKLDFQNEKNFDLVIDTTELSSPEVVDKIIKGVVEWKSK